MNKELEMTPNVLVEFLQKPASEFTKEDIIRYIYEKDIQMVNFMYPAGDGRLKTLNFVINNAAYLDAILTCGERVDGSSLFSFIEAGSSDLYVVPRFRTAFEDPFAELPTLTMLCSFFNKDGEPLESSPEYTLHKACKAFHEVTGMDFEAMGELEYYVIAPDEGVFPATDQKGYHESAPYAKFNEFRTECMHCIAQAGGQIKYGHSEVGNFTLNGLIYEQNEIEFLPCPAENAADQLMIAKWAIRNLAHEYGYNITFAPKITVGKAGSGLHVHMRIMKDGKNQMLANGILSETARKAIAGMMCLASSITAFGNTNPTSYFRLVPHQEAPTNICWGDRNRSVLVRVPLGWAAKTDMCALANPLEPASHYDTSQKQTVEMRSPDGSADLYQLLAGLAVACRHGFEIDDALEIAEKTYVNVNIHNSRDRLAKLTQELAELKDRFNEQKARWESEKSSVEEVKSLKADIDRLHAEIEEAQRNYEYEKAARLQYSDLPSLEKKLSEAEAAAERRKSDNSLVHDTVTEEEIAGIVAKWTGIPVAKLMEGEREKLLHLDEVLHRRLIGQDEAVEKVCEAIQRSRAGISDPNRPIGSFLFLGPTGVGKTELAKALAESLFDDERSMVRIDMTEYMEKFSVSRLIGAPPGYVGYDEGGQLTEAVRRKPYSVVLFDEVEKAHPDVFNILLQILDDGRITDSQGRTVDFKNTIIILTSNLGSQYLLDGIGPDGEITADAREHVQAELRRAFRPEFLNRLDEILMFRPLTRDNLSHIIDNLIAALRSRLADRTLNLEMTDAAKALVIENGYDPVYGARPLKRYLQSHAETLIARTILSGDLHAGDTLVVDADNGALVCRVKA